ncbi:MAG: DUF547 domain-containing protein [Nitrospinae bacterium]|nr:DUF547 domain-containing protein [Nitrospinota bacterium]
MNRMKNVIKTCLILLSAFVVLNNSLVMAEEIVAEEEKLVPTDFSFDDYEGLLKKYVDDNGLVNYAGLMTEKKVLDDFVIRLGKIDVNKYRKWYDNDKFALWLNAYNAFTLKVVLDNYPIKPSFLNSFRYPKNSIAQIPKVWNDKFFPILGWSMTLHGIQSDVLRAQFGYPRMYLALCMGALSSPRLRNEAYKGDIIDEQFKHQTIRFLNDPTKFKLDKEKNILYISEIFKWYGSDFMQKYGTDNISSGIMVTIKASLNYLRKFMSKEDNDYISNGTFEVEYLPYDWTLNEQPK